MSSVNLTPYTVGLLAMATLGGCATTAEQSPEAKELAAYQAAMEEAMAPATPEEIAMAERSDPIRRVSFWAEEYRKDQANLDTTLRFMRALRAIGSHDRILEIVQQSYPLHPKSHELLLELGRSFMDQNKPNDAAAAFVRAADYSPQDVAAPLAALGLAFDHMDRHDDAQEAYREALARQPERLSTLSNYGISLALTGDLAESEAVLRKAVSLPGASPQIKQNLALVLGLQGRFDEMLAVDPDAPRQTVEANKRALQNMLTPVRTYQSLEEPAAPSEEMPSVDEAVIEEDRFDEPLPALASPKTDSALSGGPQSEIVLRPKLRGAQDG
ncbi:MAG: tetratricopeptide repeat protein [Pseudomonadota bacterium]